MSKEFDALLYQLLGKLQRYHRLRHALAILCVCGLIALALNFLYQMLPRQFSLSIAGSDVVSNRYNLIKTLQTESLAPGHSFAHPAHGRYPSVNGQTGPA